MDPVVVEGGQEAVHKPSVDRQFRWGACVGSWIGERVAVAEGGLGRICHRIDI